MFARATTGECVPEFVKTARIQDLLAKGSHSRRPLLIRGESGVGKDTLARLIHNASTRGSQAFIKVSCAAQPAERHEAELFGEEKGTSPLAARRRPGSFEFANHGTLYLDEVGAIPNALVPKLLHVLRTGEISRAGNREVIRVDVQLVASTAQGATGRDGDLWPELARLDAVELWVPPLRQRPEEIPAFTSFFLERFNRRYQRQVELCADTIAALQAHPWPGNLRELAEAIHRLVLGPPTKSKADSHPLL